MYTYIIEGPYKIPFYVRVGFKYGFNLVERDGRVRLKVGGAKPELAGGRLIYLYIFIYITSN